MAGSKMEKDMANDRHGWKKSDSKSVIRIDHSDVYIENERLGEDLEFTMSNLHRSRYRQFLNRDSEINQIRKSLTKMRQVKTSGSILNRAPIGKRHAKPKVPEDTATTNCPANEGKKSTRKTRKTSFHRDRSSTAPNTPRTRNISIKMPDADEDASDSDVESSEGSDGEDNNRNVAIHSDGSDDVDNNKTHYRPFSRRSKTPKKDVPERPKSSVFEDTFYTDRRTLSLKQLKKILKLDQIPSAWYTSVVPASDVSFRKRPGRSILYELTDPSNNPHVRSWEPPRDCQTAKSVTSSPNKRHQQLKQDGFPLRPHTSLGMSRTTSENNNNNNNNNNNQGTSLFPSNNNNNNSSSNSPRSVSKLSSRPVTAPTQKSSMSSSKTVRQLREMAEQDEQDTIVSNRQRSGVELMLDETKEHRKTIDHKINEFLRSLEELQKAKRWKEKGLTLEPKKSTGAFVNLASFSPSNGHFQSGVPGDGSGWRGHHVTSHGVTSLGGAFTVEVPRPATVS